MAGVLDGIGSIAGNFAEGYRQARAQKSQQSLQQQQVDYEHANRLFQMADQVQDPKMKDTLFSSATRLLDQLETPTKAKANNKGIGAIFGSMFGIGHQKPMATAPNQPAAPATPAAAPSAVGPESQTFGNLGEMFGSALQKAAPGPAMQPPAAPGLPQVPDVDMSGVPTHKEMVSAAVPFQPPTLSSPSGTPVSQPMPTQMPAPPAPGAVHPQSGQPLNLPSPIELTQKAMQATQSPQYGFRDPVRQKMAEQQYASQIMDTLLKVTDQHLAQNPHIKTLTAADNDPNFGPEFRQVMDAIGRYEAAGQIEKGTLENWQKQRFEDVRFGSEKYNPNPETHTISDAFGNRWSTGPDGKMVPAIPGAEVKKAEPRTLEQAADAEWLKPEAERNNNVLSAYFDKISRADRARLSPTDQVQWDWLKKNKTMPIEQKATRFQSLFHPVQPAQPTVLPQPNPQTNRSELVTLNRLTGKMEPTGIMVPGTPFNAEKYMIEFQGPSVTNKAGRSEAPPKVKVYDANQLINSHRQGDPSVSVDTLRYLLRDSSNFAPGKAKEVEDYIQSISPYGTAH